MQNANRYRYLLTSDFRSMYENPHEYHKFQAMNSNYLRRSCPLWTLLGASTITNNTVNVYTENQANKVHIWAQCHGQDISENKSLEKKKRCIILGTPLLKFFFSCSLEPLAWETCNSTRTAVTARCVCVCTHLNSQLKATKKIDSGRETPSDVIDYFVHFDDP